MPNSFSGIDGAGAIGSKSQTVKKSDLYQMTNETEWVVGNQAQSVRRLLLQFLCLMLISGSPELHADEKAIDRPLMWGMDDLRPFVRKFDEPLLWGEKPRRETYRLLISPTIMIGDGGKTVRLERRGDNVWTLTTKSIDKGRLRRWTRRLSTADVQQLRDHIQQDEFWLAPLNGVLVDPMANEEAPLPNICLDGVYWILEASVEGRYHATGAQICGRDSVLVPGGLMLIKMSGRNLTAGMIE